MHQDGDTVVVRRRATGTPVAPFFGANLQTTKWENTDAFASEDAVAVFGLMNGNMPHSGQEIGDFSFALRAKVRDGQIVLWHWFEESFAVSQAYHGRGQE